MKQMKLMITGLLWMLSTGAYVLVAAWVGQGEWADSGVRFQAVMGLFMWHMAVSVPAIVLAELPKHIVDAMKEQDQ